MNKGETASRPWAGKRVVPEDAGIMAAKRKLEASAQPVRLMLPTPPTVNELFLNNKKQKGKGRIKTAKYRAWIAEATYDVRKQVTHRIEGRYTLELLVNKSTTKADIGNLEKAPSDLLQAEGVIKNDNLCDGISVRWSDEPAGALVIITPA